ncbi:hypothetical protein Cni_G27051 [Canna indica]|uniref:Uncharacterized protein n=1 Tax=Canna indica TaxID=4628 RepID=A0AAQ3L013_9LILI|nr:hypothetical protein Cni_G27051 [Canna indica]
MSSQSQDQLAFERKTELQTQTKISYARDYLLSFCNLDICKKLPSGFDASILSEINEARSIVYERQRGGGSLSYQITKFGDRDARPYGCDRGVEGTGSSKGSSCRWDARSSESSDRDGDLNSNSETSMQDSSRHFGSQSRRNWQHSEHDGLLGSGTFPKPSGCGGSLEAKSRSSSHFQLNRTSEPYQPPRPYKALPLRRKDDKDSCNDETFGSINYSNEDRAEEEQRRRASFELMRKEQQKTLQEKHKQIPDYRRGNVDADIIALLENSVDKKNIMNKIEKADDSSLQSLTDSSRHSTTQAPLSRPLVPPGFSNTASEKNLQVQSSSPYSPAEARSVITVDNLPVDDSNNDQEKRNDSITFLVTSMLKNGPISDVVVNAHTKVAVPPRDLEFVKLPVNSENVSCTAVGLQKVNEVWEEAIDNDVSSQKEEKSELTRPLMQDTPISIIEKFLTSSLSKSSGSSTTSYANQGFKEDGELSSPAIPESSKFASWFHEEENKHGENSSSKDLLSLIVNNDKVVSPASTTSADKAFEHTEANKPIKSSGLTEKPDGFPATSLMIGISEQYHQNDKSDSRPVPLKCEDLEQAILADTKGSSSNLEHAVQGPLTRADEQSEQHNSDVYDHASQHLLSLLHKGTKQENVVPVNNSPDIGLFGKFPIVDTDSTLNLGIAEKTISNNSETISSSEKTLTLEALFGPTFMNELQSAQAPVSVKSVADDGTNSAYIPTSHRFQLSNSDSRLPSSYSGDYQSDWPINGGDMISLNNIQERTSHYAPGPGKEHENFLGATSFMERALDIHLADENSLITGRTSHLPHVISQARPLHSVLDNLTNRNQQMKLIGSQNIHRDPGQNFPEVHRNAFVPASGRHIDPAACHLMPHGPHQMPVPGNFLQQLPLSGLPRGVPLSHPVNHMQGYIPDMTNVHISSHQQPNYGGMAMPGALNGHDGGNQLEALNRMIEMQRRLQENQVRPTAEAHILGILGPQFDMSLGNR